MSEKHISTRKGGEGRTRSVPEESLDASDGKSVGEALRPGEIGKVVSEDDETGDATNTVDPLEAVCPANDDGRRVARASREDRKSVV